MMSNTRAYLPIDKGLGKAYRSIDDVPSLSAIVLAYFRDRQRQPEHRDGERA